jgi:quercetin dioxygenase-like cupin family protein
MVKVVKAGEQKVYRGPEDGRTKMLIHPGMGAKNLSLGSMVFPVGGRTASHTRATEEVIFIVRGKSAIHINGEPYELEAGDAIYIPPNTEHYHENIGDGELEHVWVFSPPGPEQLFHEMETE